GGARVSLAGPGVTRQSTTGTEGEFAFTRLPAGLYTVSATVAEVGCEPITAELETGETLTTSIDCSAAQPRTLGTITGTVTAGGAPVGGAQVTLLPAELRSVLTDAAGRFTFSELNPQTFVVLATAPGFSCESKSVNVMGLQTVTVNISCVEDDGGGAGGVPVAPMEGPGKIAFERAGRIMVVDPEGRSAFTFMDGLAASWSPDGRRLVFQRPGCPDRSVYPYTDCDDIRVVNADGSGLSAITNSRDAIDYDPVWSPDGSMVAFIRFVHGIDDSYVVVADVDPPSALWSETVLSGWWPISRPTWSPDGARIAFKCQGAPPHWEGDICVVPTNRNLGYSAGSVGSSNPNKITTDTWTDSDPAWSPDGTRIAFTTNRNANQSYIALMNPDGSGFAPLVPGRFPAWSPDGTRIVFVGGADGPGLYVVNVDGSGLIRITNDAADNAPSWGR
ncbi:MAG: carboxypeptidase regulatory-like domain-containing protein, partial [Gemmatimonadota bacterium]